MTIIEQYLSGGMDYCLLNDAKRTAICSAMIGGWPWIQEDGDVYTGTVWNRYVDSRGDYWLRYELDGTAALRLVETFSLNIYAPDKYPDGTTDGWLARPNNWDAIDDVHWKSSATLQEAIVRAVCEIAKFEWPYKVNA